eukprot:Tamp_10423.p1 GENE.Tamp_10423~~Tamp_10423.p1  ORF type:complete len:532 (+),score=92.48 Tamp_10423:98-1597(+)
MIRVLREMSENDALSDVQPGIEALAEAMRAIVRCHTDRAQADANTPPTPHLHVPYGSASTLKRSTSAASFSSYNSAWQIPNAPTNTASATSLSTTPHTHANTPHTNMHTPTPLTPSTSTGTLAVALQRESDEFQDSATQSSTLLVLKPFRDRVEDEVRVLLSLLQAYEGTMNYDFLACTQALYAANQCLKRIAASSRRGASAGPVTGGKTISEWWTQMDGYWGLNTTRALQQFLNAERCMDRREGDWDAVSVDSSFGPRTVAALQHFLNREHRKFCLIFSDDVSLRDNAPKALSSKADPHKKTRAITTTPPRYSGAAGRGARNSNTDLFQMLLSLWEQVPTDGEWKTATKRAFQCYLKYRLGIHATKLEIDGKFHVRSISALQVLLAQNEWYRPMSEQMSTHGSGMVHQSRVKFYSFQLHRWCCALQEAIISNATFVFIRIHAQQSTSDFSRCLVLGKSGGVSRPRQSKFYLGKFHHCMARAVYEAIFSWSTQSTFLRP